MTVILGLPQENLDVIEQEITERSNPSRSAALLVEYAKPWALWGDILLPMTGRAVFFPRFPSLSLSRLLHRVLRYYRSPFFRQWYSVRELAAMTRPKPSVRDAVADWFTGSAGGSDAATCLAQHAMLRCTGTVARMEALFSTRVSEFRDAEAGPGLTLHRTHPRDPVTIPPHLAGQLIFVSQVSGRPCSRHEGARRLNWFLAPLIACS